MFFVYYFHLVEEKKMNDFRETLINLSIVSFGSPQTILVEVSLRKSTEELESRKEMHANLFQKIGKEYSNTFIYSDIALFLFELRLHCLLFFQFYFQFFFILAFK